MALYRATRAYPALYCHWILKACETRETAEDLLEEVGDTKGGSYSHALKMRAAVSWGFARRYKCDHQQYRVVANGPYDGNPSLSYEVGRYMISLQRRKVRCSPSKYSKIY